MSYDESQDMWEKQGYFSCIPDQLTVRIKKEGSYWLSLTCKSILYFNLIGSMMSTT